MSLAYVTMQRLNSFNQITPSIDELFVDASRYQGIRKTLRKEGARNEKDGKIQICN